MYANYRHTGFSLIKRYLHDLRKMVFWRIRLILELETTLENMMMYQKTTLENMMMHQKTTLEKFIGNDILKV